MKNKTNAKLKPAISGEILMDTDREEKSEPKEMKRSGSECSEEPAGSRKIARQGASCSDFEERSVHLSEKSSIIETEMNFPVDKDEEILAVHLTYGQNDPRPRRRLTDFILHDAKGLPQSFDMMKTCNVFISGVILPLSGSSDIEKEQGIRCKHIGQIKSWEISGYEEGSPAVWVSTNVADYDCDKPASSYKKFYDHFFEKVCASIAVFKKLSKTSGGNPDLSLDELLAEVVRSMSGSKSFPSGESIKDFIVSEGEFIYNQLIGFDKGSEKNDQIFAKLPVLLALRGLSRKKGDLMPSEMALSHEIHGGEKMDQSSSFTCGAEDGDVKLARSLQEEEHCQSVELKKIQRSAPVTEDEIANDYPLPAYCETFLDERDEYIVHDPNKIPRCMLHNWSLYNLESRLISLELLPMKPCAEIDVTVYGSGIMSADDGSGFCLDGDPNESSSRASGAQNVDQIPIYLSAIKEWMIEYGSSMVFISIRTDMSWYRLGKPSKQYGPWLEPVLKTMRIATSISTLLKEQYPVSQLSFADIIMRVSEFEKDHPAYISSSLASVERYVVVHGQIILRLFAEYPDEMIRKCAFVTGLTNKIEERHHNRWAVKKEMNFNPRAAGALGESQRKVMKATTTRLVNRIWCDYFINDFVGDLMDGNSFEVNEDEDIEENAEAVKEGELLISEKTQKPHTTSKPTKSRSTGKEIGWDGNPLAKTYSGEAFYKRAIVCGDVISVKGAVLVEFDDSEEVPAIYFVEYMFEKSDGRKIIHGRVMLRGSQTVLGNAANEREVFLTNECMEFELGDVKQTVVVDIRLMAWGYQHRKKDADSDRIDREKADDRKRKGLPMEYYCKSLYCPERCAFFSLPYDTMGLGSGFCDACKLKETQLEKENFKVNLSKTGFTYKGTDFNVNDFVYVSPLYFKKDFEDHEILNGGRNFVLKAYVVCHLMEIPKVPIQADAEFTLVKVRRFFRPEDISAEKAYMSDIREVYYSEQLLCVPVETIEGKCEVRKKGDLPSPDCPAIFKHIFFCEHLYDPASGAFKQLPDHVRLCSSMGKVVDDAESRKKKGKFKEKAYDSSQQKRLATLNIFAGCGGLSEGLIQSGVSFTKLAIEDELPAAKAFSLNYPDAMMSYTNCNVILRAIMEKCEDTDDCISTSEVGELAAIMPGEDIYHLPLPGQVDFINAGLPCQGFSGMKMFNPGTWRVQTQMILSFLSFVDYFRPKFLLLEYMRNFVSFNKGQTFRLTLASLLEMGYQVRFGVLEAGAYGVSLSWKRAFIWAASPLETLPEWPEPMHVFAGPELKIPLPGNVQYAAVRSTASGAPFRAITVRDTVGDLPEAKEGKAEEYLTYDSYPVSWFQKIIRGETLFVFDHISKELNELNRIRCRRIPKRPGADWQDLPAEKIILSTGQMADLKPWYLPNTTKSHNRWKGLFGRLDWEGNFPASLMDPQYLDEVGMCFHPEQDRLLSVRECARSLGFPDSFHFAGPIDCMYRQIGDAVPPPLALALGRKLKEAVEKKWLVRDLKFLVGIPTLPGFKPYSRRPPNASFLYVADLIEPISKSWNMYALHCLFTAEERTTILTIGVWRTGKASKEDSILILWRCCSNALAVARRHIAIGVSVWEFR
ncbi:hypothetical protein HHK36_008903 [Tetracentron sinense]|uniref:DNA (cytosine-5)-methyltransferase n=1 Tax=Tetracentron sinense TaxID=13715 RepID=A0A835DKJ3_TETSI|nr:hypothetical protein HHK36_008903 [Tetracentron sinense]